MPLIDLHAHTVHSDGTLTPTELLERAAKVGLVAVAITDHDTTAGIHEARVAGDALDIEVIPGCEISTNLDHTSVHVLGHGFPDDVPLLEDLLRQVRRGREERNARMLDRLQEFGCRLEPDEVARHAGGQIVARPHFARAMVERGYVADAREAFDRYLKDGGPAHVVVERASPEEAIGTIRAAGGVASIAHPRQIGLPDRRAWAQWLERLVEAGLAGLEVDHPSHKPSDRTFFAELAQTFDLVRTGGSDFHGDAKLNRELGRADGSVKVTYEVWERLRERRLPPEAP